MGSVCGRINQVHDRHQEQLSQFFFSRSLNQISALCFVNCRLYRRKHVEKGKWCRLAGANVKCKEQAKPKQWDVCMRVIVLRVRLQLQLRTQRTHRFICASCGFSPVATAQHLYSRIRISFSLLRSRITTSINCARRQNGKIEYVYVVLSHRKYAIRSSTHTHTCTDAHERHLRIQTVIKNSN